MAVRFYLTLLGNFAVLSPCLIVEASLTLADLNTFPHEEFSAPIFYYNWRGRKQQKRSINLNYGDISFVRHSVYGRVTVKRVPAEKNHNLKRALQEVEVLRYIQAKRIRYVIEFVKAFTDEDSIYIVTRYVGKYSVDDYLSNTLAKRKYSVWENSRRLFTALADLQTAGILHADLKPSNLVLNKQYLAVVIDFGSAQFIQPNMKVGTNSMMSFMSPEQLKHLGASHPADVWSAGCTMLCMLNGNRSSPFFYDMYLAPPPNNLKALARFLLHNISQGPKIDDEVPSSAKGLLNLIFNNEPEKRPTARKVLSHEFFRHKMDETRKFYDDNSDNSELITDDD